MVRAVDWPRISSDVSQAAQHLSQVFNATGGTYKLGIPVNANPGIYTPAYSGRAPTAHDFLVDLNLRAHIQENLTIDRVMNATSSPLASAFLFFVTHVDTVAGFTDQIDLLVTLTFEDGSPVKYILTLTSPPDHVEGSARDNDQNALPEENTAGNQGSWRFRSDENFGRFRWMMTRHGAFTHGMGSWTCTSIYDCTGEASAGTLTCTRRILQMP